MARIAGVDIPKEKRIDISLSYVYGIGRPLAARLIHEARIDPAKRTKSLTGEEVSRLNALIAKEIRVEGDLRRAIAQDIKRLMEIGSYRGQRHRRNLPARGQRTRTNARTKRGKRKTIGAVKAEKAPSAPRIAPASPEKK